MSHYKEPHLLTPYVFVDTEAFQAQQFDWTSRVMESFLDLCKDGQIKLLTTDITKREISSHLKILADEASHAVRKHRSALISVGAKNAVEAFQNVKDCASKLEAAFEKYMAAAKVNIIPTTANLDAIIDSYFNKSAPFNDKKKSEFPDAIVIASLRDWANKHYEKVYVVSSDQDLKACCTELGRLYHCESIAKIVTRATVSAEIYEKIKNYLRTSSQVKRAIEDELRSLRIRLTERRRPTLDDIHDVSANLKHIQSVTVNEVDVASHTDYSFACSISFELTMIVVVEVEMYGRSHFRDEPPYTIRYETDSYAFMNADIAIHFDGGSMGSIDVEAAQIQDDYILLDFDEVTENMPNR